MARICPVNGRPSAFLDSLFPFVHSGVCMAFEMIVKCAGSPHPQGFFLLESSKVLSYSPGLSYAPPSAIVCLDSSGNSLAPSSVSVLGTTALTLNDAGALISAAALCWAVAWLSKRVLRSFGHI